MSLLTAPCFAIVAGEDSGDILGADLMVALRERYPHATFEGIGGRRMLATGLVSLYPLERLSVMGLIEPLKRLPEFIRLFYRLKQRWVASRPLVYIGIDAPDFNLRLEKALKSQGIKIVHYVSPTIWAWRSSRIHYIKQAVDLMLGILPFEKTIYDAHGIRMEYVGHPLADTIPLQSDPLQARQNLGLPTAGRYVALLPGSRQQELAHLLIPFLQTARWLLKKDPHLRFITACVNEARERQWKEALREFPDVPISLYQGQSIAIMAASDVILVASGTASLQAMLVKRPTVVAYKMRSLAYYIARWLIKVKYIALPNLLAGSLLMPEYIQSKATPDNMGIALWERLSDSVLNQKTQQDFERLHYILRKKAGQSAAMAIDTFIKDHLCRLQELTKLEGGL